MLIAHTPFPMLHLKMCVPAARPVTEVPASDGVTMVAVPDKIDQVPVPTPGTLPAIRAVGVLIQSI